MLIGVVPPVIFLSIAFCLALHHFYEHCKGETDKAREESCAVCCYLQLSDIRNHEVWIVCLICISITWYVAINMK